MTTKLTAVVLSCCLGTPAWADPPELVRVIRNVRVLDAGGVYAHAGADVNVLGMSTVSGIDQGWQVELHDSFASIEALDQAMAARRRGDGNTDLGGTNDTVSDDLLGSARSMIGLYRQGFSYRAEEAVKNLPKARYMLVSIFRVPAGDDSAFAQVVRLRRARNSSINLDRPELVYEVITGGPVGTYLFLAPLPTLKMLDDGLAKTPDYAEGVRDAAKQAASETRFSQERLLLRVVPGMSYVSDEFAAGDLDFWRAK